MEDIAPGLLERVRVKFEADARADARVKAFLRKVEKGTATQDDCGAYADRLGKLLSDAMAAVVTPEALPNGILYQNIAEKLLTPTLRDVYERVNENAARVQKKEDEARHIGMNAAKPAFPEARVRDLTYVIGRPDNAQEQALSFLRESVRTISRSFHDDFIEENARQRWYAGMDPIVSREASAGCCEWCAALAGNWDYGDAEHLGVFRRHQFCRCSVTYSCDGRAQDMWSKKYYEADPETLKERAEYGIDEQIRVFSENRSVSERERVKGFNSNRVDIRLFDAPGYQEKFVGISGNKDTDEQIYKSSIEILTRKKGTDEEELYLIDAESGTVIHRRTESSIELGITYNEETERAIEQAHKQGKRIIAIHNHPNGLPPTMDDGVSAFVHGYEKGVVVGHNLEVWTYSPTSKAYDRSECQAVHEMIAKKLRFYVDFEETEWYDNLIEYGMEIKRR